MRRIAALVALSAALTTACGTRMTHTDVVAASHERAAGSGVQQASAATNASDALGTGVGGASAGGGLVTPTGAQGGAGSAAASEAASRRSAPAGGATASSGEGPASSGAKSPIVIGSVGTLSGPAGASLKDLPEGVQVWARDVNARGGIAGHPVQLIVSDDGGDPARSRTQVQLLVEDRHVIAFVGNVQEITGAPSVSYVTSKRIPVIGNAGGSDWFYSSPMYFTPISTGQTFWISVASSVASVARTRSLTKFGSITCQEATTCADADRSWHAAGNARAAGLQPVYRARASLAQPDFTAECLAARNAGAQILTMVMDSVTVNRVAASCARQGYHPMLTWVQASAKSDHVKDPNLEGGMVTVGNFLWTENDTPATAEYQAAMRRYLGHPPNAGHASGWAAGKVFEVAAAKIGEPPTAQAVLEGLWSFRAETVGGLTMPLTFPREKPAPRQVCWATNVIQHGRWEPFNGGRIECR